MRKGPKIVVIGAGSASFGLTNLGAILRTKELHGGTLALCDLNSSGLEKIFMLAQRVNREWEAQMTIEQSTDCRELLPGADFVVISVAIDREKCWEQDHELGKKYGIIHYAENAGPGGFFHAARNITLLMPVFRAIEELCPEAYVLNFTNPMSRICTAAARYTKLHMTGICHQIDFGYMMAGRILGKTLGLSIDHDYLFRWNHDPEEHRIAAAAHERLDILAAGTNHFTWFLSIKDKQTGEELFPLFKKLFLEQKEFEPYTRSIIKTFDQCPTSGDAHFLEYMPFTSNPNRGGWDKYNIQMYPLRGQDKMRDQMWQDISDMAEGRKEIGGLKHVHTERAEIIMASIWSDSHHYDYAVNVPNTNGLIANMERDAVVEVPAVMGIHGVQGIAVGELPEVPAAFCNRQKEIVDLAVRAAVEGDRGLALQALCLDPMIDDIETAGKLLEDGLRIFKEYLPQFQ